MARQEAAQVRYVEKPSYNQKARPIKKVGREPGLKLTVIDKDGKSIPNPKVKRFFADKKKMMLMNLDVEHPILLIFNDYIYETDNKKDIEYLETHPQFNVHMWHNAPPEAIAKKLKKDRESLTRDPDF
jgi:hypothetical protein